MSSTARKAKVGARKSAHPWAKWNPGQLSRNPATAPPPQNDIKRLGGRIR